MNARIFPVIAAATLLLAGCPKPPVITSGPSTSTTKKNACLVDTTMAYKCKRPDGGGQPMCRMVAFGIGGTALVYPYKLNVGKHGRNRQVTIVWELIGEGETFVQSKSDGPVQLLTDTRFSNAWVSATPDGAASAATGKYFRIDFANDAHAGTAGIAYDLQFSDVDNVTVKCDPTIVNESG